MDKQAAAHLYNGILFSQKKESSTDTCCYTDERYKYYAKRKKPGQKGHIFYDYIYMK